MPKRRQYLAPHKKPVPTTGAAGGLGYAVVQDDAPTAETGKLWYDTDDTATAQDHGALSGLNDDDHPRYLKEEEFTAKGDILAGLGASWFTALTLGSYGQVLTVDSGESLGLKWSAPDGASTIHSEGTNYTTTNTSFEDVDATDLSLTITTRANASVDIYVTLSFSNNGANTVYFDIDVDGSRVSNKANGIVHQQVSPADYAISLMLHTVASGLSAGSHAFKLQWRVSAGTGTIFSDSNNVVSFSVQERL